MLCHDFPIVESHGLSQEEQDNLKHLLRRISNAMTTDDVIAEVGRLRRSEAYVSNVQVQDYLEKHWLNITEVRKLNRSSSFY